MSEVKDTRAGSPSAEPAPPPPARHLFHLHAPETAAVACLLEDLHVWWGLSLTWGPAPTAPAPGSWHGGLLHPFLQVALSLCLTSSLLSSESLSLFSGNIVSKAEVIVSMLCLYRTLTHRAMSGSTVAVSIAEASTASPSRGLAI